MARFRLWRSPPRTGRAVLERRQAAGQNHGRYFHGTIRGNAIFKGEALMRLPFFYGWIIVVVTFVTMAIGANARTAFSLFFPPIINEFGWERGITAGALSLCVFVFGRLRPPLQRVTARLRPPRPLEPW